MIEVQEFSCSSSFHRKAIFGGSRDLEYMGLTDDETYQYRCRRCGRFIEAGIIERKPAGDAMAAKEME